MNIIQIQDRLKDFSEQQLVNEMQRPTGSAPQYLVLSELERRQKVKQSFESQQGSEPSVAEEAVMSRMMPAQMTARAGMGLPNPAQQPMRMQRGGSPLGIRQNNPGNIERGAGFIGGVGTSGRYDTFDDPVFGIRAISRLADTYATNYDIDTPREFLSRYAPRSDNPESFDNYLGQLSRDLGVNPDEEIDFTDPSVKRSLIPSIIGFEQGSEFRDFYDPELINAGIRATKLQDPDEIKELAPSLAEYEAAGLPLLASASGTGIGPQSEKTGMFRRSAQAARTVRDPLDQLTPIEQGEVVPELIDKQAMEERRKDPPIDVRGKRQKEADRIAQFEEQRDPDDPTVTDEEIASLTSYLQAERQGFPTDADDDAIALTKPEFQQRAEAQEEIEQQKKDAQQDETNLYDKLRQLAEDRVTAAEEDAEFNKFLALAQMGAALAQSDRGFVGAIGEGIEAGLPTLAATRKPLREAQEGILDTEIDIAKIQADAGKKGELTVDQRLRLANQLNDDILNNQKEIQRIQEGLVSGSTAQDIARLQQEIRQFQLARANLSAGLYSVPSQQVDPLNALSVEAIDQVLQSRGTQ